MPEQRLAGRYRLVRPIASGGMAKVWEADDEVLTRPVAVKILHPHLASDQLFVARFRAEAINAARLTHPGIVSIYDTWSGDGVEAIVMELVRGTTLRHLLDHRGPLQPDEAVTIADHVAAALDAAHQAGIVHRDIKPANVLLSADGRVLVTDFGIAKATEGADLTAERTMLGTAKYLAPEQVEGAAIDGRTDLYALGVLLYEMLAGQVPFKAETEAATALARLHRLPDPPSSHRPGLSPSLEAVVLQCLAREPAGRPADAPALRRLLAQADRQLGPGAPRASATPITDPVDPGPSPALDPPADVTPPRSRSKGPWLIGALVAVAVLLVGGLGLTLRRPGAAGAVTMAEAAAYDPLGHPPGEENNADAPLAVDGDPATAWSTERYRDPARLGKAGVGLLVRFDRTTKVTDLVIESPSQGWSAAVIPLRTIPTEGAQDQPAAASATAIGPGRTRLSLHGARAAGVLIWITRTGDDGRVVITEVTATGRPG